MYKRESVYHLIICNLEINIIYIKMNIFTFVLI